MQGMRFNPGRCEPVRFWRQVLPYVLLLVLAGCHQKPEPRGLVESRSLEHLKTNATVVESFGPYERGALLADVRGHEAQLEVILLGPKSERIHHTSIDYIRLPPQYLVIGSDEASKGFSIEVMPRNTTRNSSVDIRIYTMPESSRADRLIGSAFVHYSEGIASSPGEDPAVFAQKKEHLQRAAEIFRDAGEWEIALWADALAAYFLYWPIMDYGKALTHSERIRNEAVQRGYPRVELMMLNLEGEVLTEICAKNPYQRLIDARLAALERYDAAAALAENLGERHELAWSLNNLGIAHYYLDDFNRAEFFYNAALDVSTELRDDWFSERIRGSLAMSRETSGGQQRFADSLAHWQAEIERLRGGESASDLKHALVEQGRVYRILNLYPEAVAALSEALALSRSPRDVHNLGRTSLWLAESYMALGDFDRASEQLERSLPVLQKANDCRLLQTAYRRQANLARKNGRFDDVKVLRKQQDRYATSGLDRAVMRMDMGEDASANPDSEPGEAAMHFEQAYDALSRLQDPVRLQLSSLRMCAQPAVPGRRPGDCNIETLRSGFMTTARQASPGNELELAQAWVDLLMSRGRTDEALEQLENVIERIAAYRQLLPGVLGAWYWESRQEIFETYIDLVIEKDMAAGSGAASLLALDWLRNLEAARTGTSKAADYDTELRSLAVSLESIPDPEERDAIRRQIDLRLASDSAGASLTEPGNEPWFYRAISELPEDVAVLAFHFADSGSWAWRIRKDDISLRRISGSAAPAQAIEALKSRMRVRGDPRLSADLESMGTILLGEENDRLPEYLFVLTGGALNGFPFDMLRTGNGYLAKQNIVVNMSSLSGLGGLGALLENHPQIDSVFAAGASEWSRLGMPDLPAVTEEIELVSSSFPSAELFSVTGESFNPDVTQSKAFRSADLIHIASHAQADLTYPELSRLYFGNADSVDDFQTPHALSGLKLDAKLVILSACDTSGSNEFSFDSNLGFVSTMMKNGAEAVLATLWPVPDDLNLALMRNSYRRLEEGAPIIKAFGNAKKNLLDGVDEDATGQVFAYQLYIQ